MYILRRDGPIVTDDMYAAMTDEDWQRIDAEYERRVEAYRVYADSIRDQLPRRSFPAYGPWYLNDTQARGPHDATIDSVLFAEPRRGKNARLRRIDIRVRLLSAYRDAVMDITFRKVRSYTMSIPPEYDWPEKVQRVGHGDWLDYELRLTERALPVLEVEFSAGGYWMIESEDIIYRLEPLQPRVRKVNR